MQAAVRRHDTMLREIVTRNGGYVFKTIGDAFCVAFSRASDAVTATLEAQRAFAAEDWSEIGDLRVRMAIHTGIADERDNDYFGPTVNRVARLLAIGHGGQVLVSSASQALAAEFLHSEMKLFDLGTHRLKDISAPERVFQLCAPGLRDSFEPLRSLDASTGNLPASLAPLIGRNLEITEILALLGRARLVTLIGPGGVGKTRAALQAAADYGAQDGAWFVDMTSCTDSGLVPSLIATSLDFADEGGSQLLLDRLGGSLKSKEMLLLVDNCEQIVHAVASAADRLLQLCPRLRILATSREPLGLGGEELYRMPSLPVPPDGETMTAQRVLEYPAAALFVSRARAVQQSFEVSDANAELVAEIVRRLDGIALAIELAAPRVKVLKLAQIAARLDDKLKLLTGGSRSSLPRHQTLRATITWSYDLLKDRERSLFRHVSIFRGSWTLEAAEALWRDEAFLDADTLDTLAALVDKSLVVVEGRDEDEPRYRLLASMREFGLECLSESGEREVVASRHCQYFHELGVSAGDDYWKVHSERWTSELRLDLENYRGAIAWALENGAVSRVASIVANLRWYWPTSARPEGSALVERLLELLPPDTPHEERGLIVLTATALTVSRKGVESASEAVALLAGSQRPELRAEAQNVLAGALCDEGRFEEAVAVAETAVSEARAARIPRLVGCMLSSLGYVLACVGKNDEAVRVLDEAGPILRRCDDRATIARVGVIRAEQLFKQGDISGALASSREAETIYRERRAGVWLLAALINETAYLIAAGECAEAWSVGREALGQSMAREEELYVAAVLGHFARIAAESGNADRAALIAGFVDAAYDRIGNAREPTEQQSYDRLMELLRGALPEDRLKALMDEGAMLDMETAAKEALHIPQPA